MVAYNCMNFYENGVPWFPVMGEYQYARTDSRYWAEDLAKMKALGVEVVSSYVFWIYHEEIKGRFDFRGNKNLRKFVRLIKEADMKLCLRIGPWVHAETRNGGFPDWIGGQNYEPRSNDAGYMADVEYYFNRLYSQCEGMMYKDGGPIFAIQVENEYSQWGRQGRGIGDEHINALISMLKKIGFDVPVYMATGWGQAATGNALPVWGSYCEAPWERTVEELPPMDGYLFSRNPNDANIGSDTGRKEMTADISSAAYPFATVELGSGIQMTKVRRPVCRGEDNGALTVCRLGSGVSWLGYYVFHGGMHSDGALTSMQEYRDERALLPGFCCDLSEKDYDFQAPISQYGRMHESAFELKLWTYFIRDFGKELCCMPVVFPENEPDKPNDFKHVRYTVRQKENSGFVFFNNYVRRYDMEDFFLKDFGVTTESEKVTFPNFFLKNKRYCVFPFNLQLDGATIKAATASPFCVLNKKDYVFWAYDGEGRYEMEGEYKKGRIITLTKEEALRCFKFTYRGKERLFMCEGEMFETEEGLAFCFTSSPKLKIYPPLETSVEHFEKQGFDGIFGVYKNRRKTERPSARFVLKERKEEYSDYSIEIDYGTTPPDNAYLKIFFSGDSIDFSIDKEKLNDRFYNGEPFEIGLKYYGFPKTVDVRVYPMKKGDFVFVEKQPTFDNGVACRIDKTEIENEYRVVLK